MSSFKFCRECEQQRPVGHTCVRLGRNVDASGLVTQVQVPTEDPIVVTPDHYTQGDIETIDALRSALGPAGFRGYCAGNAIKYIWRHQHKGALVKDLQKAKQYIDYLLEEEL